MRKYHLLIAPLAIVAGNSTNAQVPVHDAVVGQAVDEQGYPIAGAQISVRYQSNPGGVSISRRRAPTGRDAIVSIFVSRPVSGPSMPRRS